MKKQNNRILFNISLSIFLTAGLLLVCSCSTAPVEDRSEEQTFVFLFMSDTQANPQKADYSGFGSLLARAVEKGNPGLLLLGGDSVNDGADQDEWLAFHEAVGASLDGIPVAAVAGNHDADGLLAKQFTWPSAAPESLGQGFFYSFSMNGIHFSMLDSNIMGAANPDDVYWLEEVLSSDDAMKANWRIAVCHHPFWPVADIPRDVARAQTMREHFLPLLEEYEVDLLLVGHQHSYARSFHMSGEKSRGKGLVQVMVASGDKPGYLPVEHHYLTTTAETNGYVLISASANQLTLAVYDPADNIIDFFALSREE